MEKRAKMPQMGRLLTEKVGDVFCLICLFCQFVSRSSLRDNFRDIGSQIVFVKLIKVSRIVIKIIEMEGR